MRCETVSKHLSKFLTTIGKNLTWNILHYWKKYSFVVNILGNIRLSDSLTTILNFFLLLSGQMFFRLWRVQLDHRKAIALRWSLELISEKNLLFMVIMLNISRISLIDQYQTRRLPLETKFFIPSYYPQSESDIGHRPIFNSLTTIRKIFFNRSAVKCSSAYGGSNWIISRL